MADEMKKIIQELAKKILVSDEDLEGLHNRLLDETKAKFVGHGCKSVEPHMVVALGKDKQTPGWHVGYVQFSNGLPPTAADRRMALFEVGYQVTKDSGRPVAAFLVVEAMISVSGKDGPKEDVLLVNSMTVDGRDRTAIFPVQKDADGIIIGLGEDKKASKVENTLMQAFFGGVAKACIEEVASPTGGPCGCPACKCGHGLEMGKVKTTQLDACDLSTGDSEPDLTMLDPERIKRELAEKWE